MVGTAHLGPCTRHKACRSRAAGAPAAPTAPARRSRGRLLAGLALVLALLAPPRAGAEPRLSPIYLIESVQIEGNKKTKNYVILHSMLVSPGERLSVDHPRFELSRLRLLSLGYFSDVRLRLKKGSRRGRAILVVRVKERGTIVVTDLFMGSSEATTIWGGIGLAENNLLGRGISLAGAFVLGSMPEVADSRVQQSYLLQLGATDIAGTSLSLGGSLAFLDGSEFFRRAGPEGSSAPDDFLSIPYRRVGGDVGLGFDLTRAVRMYMSYRAEYIKAEPPLGAVRRRPDGASEPIDFDLRDGSSVLSMLSVCLEWDTRSDPALPHRGTLAGMSADFSSTVLGSAYEYVKLRATVQHYFPLSWGHVLSLQVMGGVIFGEAPFFEQFFMGDLNDLVPSRALRLNFSTLPSRDIFGTAIDSKRYEEFAARFSLEYIVPWFRGGRFFYSGDFFVNAGVILLTSNDDLRMRDRDLAEALPVDLTLDAGLRLDTYIGVFRLSIGNALGRIPF